MPRRPKYRLLTTDELEELEKEFIEFLIVNGITADDWEKLKREQNGKAEDMLVLFSDVVFNGVMKKVRFLELRTPSEVKTFQCLEEKMVLVGMYAVGNKEVDFSDSDFLQKAAVQPPKNIKVYTADKPYTKTRELELFEMTQTGCSISDGSLFKALSMALV